MTRKPLPNRRRFLALTGAGVLGSLAGCAGDEPADDDTGDDDGTVADDDYDDDAADDDDTQPEPDEVDHGGDLNYITSELPPSLDVHQKMGYGVASQYIAFERLIKYDQNLEFETRLATDYEVVDEQTYVFEIRDGVPFHDGSEFNAEVAAWNFDRFRSDYADSAQMFSPIEDAEVTGNSEITVHLSQTFPPLLDALAAEGYMVSRAALEDEDDEWMQTNPVGTGPFEFESWDERDDVIEYVAFDDYWRTDEDGNELPYLDSWTFNGIPEPQTQLQVFESEGNYLHGPSEEFIEDLMEDDDYTVSEVLSQSNTINYLTMKNNVEPFDDERVREAIYYGIDNEEVRDFVPHMQEIVGPLPEHNWGSNPNIEPEYDPDQAQQILSEAGYSDGLEVTLTVWSDDPQYEQVATVVQDQLSRANIEVDIEVVETLALLEGLQEGEIGFAGVHWGGGGHIDPYGNLHNLYHSEGEFNYITSYQNQEVDDVLDEALSTVDRDERAELYQEAEQMIFDDHPKVWFGRFGQFATYYDEVHGVEPIGATGFFTDDYADIWIEN